MWKKGDKFKVIVSYGVINIEFYYLRSSRVEKLDKVQIIDIIGTTSLDCSLITTIKCLCERFDTATTDDHDSCFKQLQQNSSSPLAILADSAVQ
jgi:hypothetical protein